MICFSFVVNTTTLIVGDSHVRRLGEKYQFSDTEIFGVGGMTTGQLRHEHMQKMRRYNRIIILVGGNDVCPNLRTGRPPIATRTVMANLRGMLLLINLNC